MLAINYVVRWLACL